MGDSMTIVGEIADQQITLSNAADTIFLVVDVPFIVLTSDSTIASRWAYAVVIKLRFQGCGRSEASLRPR